MSKLRWPAKCVVCGARLSPGDRAWWDATSRMVTCMTCPDVGSQLAVPQGIASPLDRGAPAASVAREYRRRRSKREAQTRRSHPRIGGLLLALRGPPRQESAWRKGALGEHTVASYLERCTADGPAIVLYDRGMPGTRANIDVLAVAPTGVYVIDVKANKGKVRVATLKRGSERLQIEGWNRTRWIDGLEWQISAVRGALSASGHLEVPVLGVLCFTKADFPLLGTLEIRGHRLLHRRALAKKLNNKGALTPTAIDAVARTLAVALEPA